MGCGATKAVQVQPADAVEPLAPGDHPGTSGIPSGVELELDRLSTLDDLPSGESGEPRVLLLGAGDCGKSTLFRQLQLLYGGTAAAKNSYVLAGAVRSHLFHTLREATQGMARLGIEFAEPQNIARAQTLLDVAKVDDATVRGLDDDVAAVGADAGLRAVLKRGAAVHLPESAAYFLDAASRILAPGYVPTGDDVLRMRVRTRGVALAQVSAFGRDFEVVDVGGARTERRKWAGRLQKQRRWATRLCIPKGAAVFRDARLWSAWLAAARKSRFGSPPCVCRTRASQRNRQTDKQTNKHRKERWIAK